MKYIALEKLLVNKIIQVQGVKLDIEHTPLTHEILKKITKSEIRQKLPQICIYYLFLQLQNQKGNLLLIHFHSCYIAASLIFLLTSEML